MISDVETRPINTGVSMAELEDDKITCWCGATGSYDELFAPIPDRCGGAGFFDCDCGGDLCVCHNHGEVECFGCEDCDPVDPQYDGWLDE